MTAGVTKTQPLCPDEQIWTAAHWYKMSYGCTTCVHLKIDTHVTLHARHNVGRDRILLLTSRWRYASFLWVILDPFPVDLLRHVMNNWSRETVVMMDNRTSLFISCRSHLLCREAQSALSGCLSQIRRTLAIKGFSGHIFYWTVIRVTPLIGLKHSFCLIKEQLLIHKKKMS